MNGQNAMNQLKKSKVFSSSDFDKKNLK